MRTMLKHKYELVAQALASGKSQKDSYKSAGYSYSPASARNVCLRPDIIARVNEIFSERKSMERRTNEIAAKAAGIDKSWVLQRQAWMAEKARLGVPVLDEQGRPTGRYKEKPHYAVAARLL